MQKRRSHTKSRRGCKGCKEKHIKCDEQGPPCANCKSRGLPCAYPQQRSSRGSGGPSKSSSSPSTSSSSNSTQLSPRPSISAHLLPIDSSPTRRLLELELMHRWSTRTYKGMCGIPSDATLMQLELPRQGLSEHPSLLHGILSLSALDLATTTPDPRQVQGYHRAALEYYGHATRAFQDEMLNITRQNHFALYMLSAFFGVFHSAVLHLPSITDGSGSSSSSSSSSSGGPGGGKGEEEQVKMPPNSVLDRIPEMFALQRGTAVIASKTFMWLNEDYESFRLVREMGGAPASLLDADTRRALARLNVVNDALYGVVRTPSSSSSSSDDYGFDDGGGEGVAYGDIAIKALLHPSHETYAAAISDLRRCFAEHARGWIDGFVMAFPMWMGKDVVGAVERRDDPMALLVLMYFGVLLEFNGRNQWWCASLGAKLVVEISDVFVRSGREFGPEFWDAVAWARRQCGLSVGGVVSSSSSSSSSSLSQDGRSGEVEVLE